jgi:tetratricopeptide (TPR) repeat protein
MRKRTIILCLFLLTAVVGKSNATEPPTAAQAARQQANCGEWHKAIESYNRALTTSPKDAVCLARRGYAYARLGNYKQAFADFTTAIECDTKCPDAYSQRSRVYCWLGLEQLAMKDAHKALGLIASVPKEPELLLEHAALLYSVDKKQDADRECKQVLASYPHALDFSTLLIASGANCGFHQYQDSVN